jgi:hypothetical protein
MCTVAPPIYKVLTAPHSQSTIFNWIYLRCYWRYVNNSMRLMLQTWCQIQRTTSSFALSELWSRTYTMYLQLHIFRIPYSAECIFAVIGDISTTQCALYCKLGANTAHNLRFALSELWSHTYTMNLQLLIFRLQYSTKRICAAFGDMSTIQCASHCIYCAKYSARPPVNAIWTVVTDIYNGVTVPHIQASIFN